MIERFGNNPLVGPADVKPSRDDLEVTCAFNAGATLHGGKTVLLIRVAERPVPEEGYVAAAFLDPQSPGGLKVMRVKLDQPDLDTSDPRVFVYKGRSYLTSISHLRMATSEDGRKFTVAEAPAVAPETPWEQFGIEDARITLIDGTYLVNYSAISPNGVSTCLARTADLVAFERLGIIFTPHNKDIAIFPEKIGGRYCCFHRPSPPQFGAPSVWLAFSDNLTDWGGHRYLLGPRDRMWDCERVGCGPPPIRTAEGWLEIYHGCDNDIRYCCGALLLDLDDPGRVIARGDRPLLAAEAPYETAGFMPNVVFCNGLVEREGDKVDLYYGAADETVCGATLDVAAVLDSLKRQ